MVGAGSRSAEVHYEVCAGWRRRGKDWGTGSETCGETTSPAVL